MKRHTKLEHRWRKWTGDVLGWDTFLWIDWGVGREREGWKRWVDTGEGLFRLIDDWTKANDKRPKRCEVKKGEGAKLKYRALKQTLVKSDRHKKLEQTLTSEVF